MFICDHCKTEFDESQRMPTERSILCSMDCADKLLEKVVQEALNYRTPSHIQQPSAEL